MPKIEVLPFDPAPARRLGSRRPKRSPLHRWVGWAATCLALGVCLGVAVGVAGLWLADATRPPVPSSPLLVVLDQHLTPGRHPRDVYPYSVVAGGVRGPDDALAAAEADPVVAEHYRDLRLAALRVTSVERARAVHVSYRIGDRVFWTRRKVTLQPGEMLLSDGGEAIRARCGNCVSDTPREPTSDQEPVPEVFDSPVPTTGTKRGGGIDLLRAYDLLASGGTLPPSLSGEAFAPRSVVASAGLPGGGTGTPGGVFGGFPGGFGGGSGGGFGGSTPGIGPTDVGNPDGDAPRDGRTPPRGEIIPPPGDGVTPPRDGGPILPPGGGTVLPPGGGGETTEPPMPAPEPSALLLLGAGLFAVALPRLRRY